MKTRPSAREEQAAYMRGMAKLCKDRGYHALAESYEMGAKDVFEDMKPRTPAKAGR